jgi:hypothetical protein
VPVLVAGLVLLLLCGGGAAAATYGVGFLGGFITGDERGTDVLAQPGTATEGPLTLTVTGVEQTRHFTRVHLTAANSGEDTLSLPVFGYTQLTGGRTTLTGDPSRSDWPIQVPAGSEVSGTVVFSGHLPAGTTSASLTFTTIFGSLRAGGRSIKVTFELTGGR